MQTLPTISVLSLGVLGLVTCAITPCFPLGTISGTYDTADAAPQP